MCLHDSVLKRSFPLTEEEYLLRLDDVANTLKCWGAVSHIRNSLEKLKERPRIGKVNQFQLILDAIFYLIYSKLQIIFISLPSSLFGQYQLCLLYRQISYNLLFLSFSGLWVRVCQVGWDGVGVRYASSHFLYTMTLLSNAYHTGVNLLFKLRVQLNPIALAQTMYVLTSELDGMLIELRIQTHDSNSSSVSDTICRILTKKEQCYHCFLVLLRLCVNLYLKLIRISDIISCDVYEARRYIKFCIPEVVMNL